MITTICISNKIISLNDLNEISKLNDMFNFSFVSDTNADIILDIEKNNIHIVSSETHVNYSNWLTTNMTLSEILQEVISDLYVPY